ncbi:hypothetical protein O3P69_002764 [Scylla paramamosain]|uniref:Uncharacterized protein n=1 Tax=Scylla paramamosain TaxID=85552 RepID=A0AAW0UMY6_SCYPA
MHNGQRLGFWVRAGPPNAWECVACFPPMTGWLAARSSPSPPSSSPQPPRCSQMTASERARSTCLYLANSCVWWTDRCVWVYLRLLLAAVGRRPNEDIAARSLERFPRTTPQSSAASPRGSRSEQQQEQEREVEEEEEEEEEEEKMKSKMRLAKMKKE